MLYGNNDLAWQGTGWIVVGLGLFLAIMGIGSTGPASTRMSGRIPAAESPTSVRARRRPKSEAAFVCSDCGGDLTEDMKVCPHCGAPIEGEEP